MKLSVRTIALIALALPLFASCKSTGGGQHWKVDSLAPRMVHHVMGYDVDRGESYTSFSKRNRQHINLTIRRHLLNENPNNPFVYDESWFPWILDEQNLSPLPNPVFYFHLESLVTAAAFYGNGGPFAIFPLSVLALFEEEGRAEFLSGLPFVDAQRARTEPRPTSEFRVKNP